MRRLVTTTSRHLQASSREKRFSVASFPLRYSPFAFYSPESRGHGGYNVAMKRRRILLNIAEVIRLPPLFAARNWSASMIKFL